MEETQHSSLGDLSICALNELGLLLVLLAVILSGGLLHLHRVDRKRTTMQLLHHFDGVVDASNAAMLTELESL